MGRPSYWPGPTVTPKRGGPRSLSVDQGKEIVRALQRRLDELKLQIESAGGEERAPVHLSGLVCEVTPKSCS
jgi:hypothetical protein